MDLVRVSTSNQNSCDSLRIRVRRRFECDPTDPLVPKAVRCALASAACRFFHLEASDVQLEPIVRLFPVLVAVKLTRRCVAPIVNMLPKQAVM